MKYTPEMIKSICDRIKMGASDYEAAIVSGIHKDTFYEWMKKPDFSDSVKKAELECKQRNAAIIQKAALTTWQAAAWWLERKYREEFALKQPEFVDTSKKEMSKKSVDAAMNALKLIEEAGRNVNARAGSIGDQSSLENGKVGLQTKSSAARGL